MISVSTLQVNSFSYMFDGDRDILKLTKRTLKMMRAKRIAGNINKLLGCVVVSNVASVDSNDDATKMWHIRLDHLSECGMGKLHKSHLVKGVRSYKLDLCKYCILGKLCRVHFKS